MDGDIIMPVTPENAGAISQGIPKGSPKNVKRFKKYLRKPPGSQKRPPLYVRVLIAVCIYLQVAVQNFMSQGCCPAWQPLLFNLCPLFPASSKSGGMCPPVPIRSGTTGWSTDKIHFLCNTLSNLCRIIYTFYCMMELL